MEAYDIYEQFEADAKRILNYLGLNTYYHSDILNDFYLKLHKLQQENKLDRLYIDINLNTPYLFSMLSNLVSDFRKSNNQYCDPSMVEIADETTNPDLEMKEELARYFITLIPSMFDKQLLKIYIKDDKSMRTLSKETNISVDTIFKSLRYSKTFVKEKTIGYLKKINGNGNV